MQSVLKNILKKGDSKSKSVKFSHHLLICWSDYDYQIQTFTSLWIKSHSIVNLEPCEDWFYTIQTSCTHILHENCTTF